MSEIYLGKDIRGEKIYLCKHEWHCGWYWALGYLGNKNLHFHFESWLKADVDKWTDIESRLSETKLTQNQWWILLDLFRIAYALKNAAKVMRFGGHMTGAASAYRVNFTTDFIGEINKKLELQLDAIWELLTEWLGNAK